MRNFQNKFFYTLVAFISAVAVLLFAIWLPNFSFLKHIAVSPEFSTSWKFNLFLASLGAFETNFTPFSRLITILVSALFGINLAVTVYYLRRRISLEKPVGTGFAGILFGLIGIGCASCGSVILTSVFGLAAGAGFIAVLPLRGQEFGILSIAILSISIYLISKKIKDPMVCRK